MARLKLNSFQETFTDNPLKHLFCTPIVNTSTLVSLHAVPADLEFAGFVGDEDEDEDFNIIISEDNTALVRENAKLVAQLKQLLESKEKQEKKQAQVQPLLQLLENKQRKRDETRVADHEETEEEKFVKVESERVQAFEIKRLTELLEVRKAELEEQKLQNNKLVVNLKEREEEKEREINEYSAKLTQSMEFLEARTRSIQNDYESKLQNKDQEILLLKQQLQQQTFTRQQESELLRFQQNTASQQLKDRIVQDLQEQLKALHNYKAKSQEAERQLATAQEHVLSKEKILLMLTGTVQEQQLKEEEYLKEIESLRSTIEQIQQALDNNERATVELESRLALLLSMIPRETLQQWNLASSNRE